MHRHASEKSAQNYLAVVITATVLRLEEVSKVPEVTSRKFAAFRFYVFGLSRLAVCARFFHEKPCVQEKIVLEQKVNKCEADMPEYDGWIWQGRQSHGWFGHGTAPQGEASKDDGAYSPGSLDQRIRIIGLTAIAGLPSSKRHHSAAHFDASALDQLNGTMRVWVNRLYLNPTSLAELFFDRTPDSPVVKHLHQAAAIVARATTRADMRNAADQLAAGMLAVGLDGWQRFLREAGDRAKSVAENASLIHRVRETPGSMGAVAGFLAPTVERGPLIRAVVGALRLAGSEAAIAAALLAAGILRNPQHVQFTALRIIDHSDAQGLADWRTNQIAISVPGRDGHEPYAIVFALHFVIRDGHPIYEALDATGVVAGHLSPAGVLTLTPTGEQRLSKAQTAVPEAGSQVGIGFETRSQEEADLVASLRGEGKSAQEIESALADLRSGQGVAGAANLRDRPGVAIMSKALPPVTGPWLRGTSGNAGLVPGQVADRLLGRKFSNFGEFRQAFWRAIADIPELAVQFSRPNLALMRQGQAPVAPTVQHHGSQDAYVLHHRNPVGRGGDVYDMSNIAIVTPTMHQSILDPKVHFGGGSR